MKIGIVESHNFSKEAIKMLDTIGVVTSFDKSVCTLERFISDKDVLFVRLKYFYSEDLLSSAQN